MHCLVLEQKNAILLAMVHTRKKSYCISLRVSNNLMRKNTSVSIITGSSLLNSCSSSLHLWNVTKTSYSVASLPAGALKVVGFIVFTLVQYMIVDSDTFLGGQSSN